MACTTPMGFMRPEWGGGPGTLKRKFRWLFDIENITLGNGQALPCLTAARPKINFREMQGEHLNETISYPSKPEWQPIQISLYDRCIQTQNPIFTWLKQQYNPTPTSCSNWYPCIDPLSFKPCCFLQLLDGCGNVLEGWTLEHCYPQNIDWGDLDMNNHDFVTVSFSLKYDRAFQTSPAGDHAIYTKTNCVSCTNPPNCDGSQPPPPTPTPPPEDGGGSENEGSENESDFPFALSGRSTAFTLPNDNYKLVNIDAPDFIMII